MRHRVKKTKLSRDHDHARALVKNLLKSLFLAGKVETTQAKARVLANRAEKLIARSKKRDLSARRRLFALFQDQKFVNRIVDGIIPLFKDRSSGFVRTLRVRRRQGDDAVIIRVELVEKIPAIGGRKEENKNKGKNKGERKEKEDKKDKESRGKKK